MRSVLITGTSTGFGLVIAVELAKAGWRVFATMRNLPRPEADALAQTAKDDDLDITILELDVLSDQSVSNAVMEALCKYTGAKQRVGCWNMQRDEVFVRSWHGHVW